MRRPSLPPVLLALIALIALLALLASVPAQAAAADEPDGARVIVKFKALGPLMRAGRARGDRGPQLAATLAARQGLGLGLRDGRMIDARSQVVWGDKSISSAALAARLAQDADVEYAVPDGRRRALALPNDPLLPASSGAALPAGQWYLRAPDASLVSAIHAVGAWELTTGASSIVVAGLDTGVLTTHPDLSAQLLAGYDFVSSTTTSGDGGGRDGDATDPGDWTTAGQCGSGEAASNSSWHGTQTASIFGVQTDNGIGMASVGRNVKILPVRVLGKCGGSDSDIIAAMLWAGGVSSVPGANPNPAKIINLSLGGSGSCHAAYQDAVNQLVAAGVTVVAAAGNEAGLAVGVPANCSGVIAVAGVRHSGTKVGFSSLGPEVALSAPGGNCVNSTGACLYPILTATNSGTTTAATHTYSSGSNYAVGTSFAAPMVAGAAATASLRTTGIGSVTVQLTVTDSAGSQASKTQLITATAPAAPTVSIVASATAVTAGTPVSFDGSSAQAATGLSIASHAWTVTPASGSPANLATFTTATNASTASVSTLGSGSGTFTVTLTVADSLGQTGSASTTVTVTPLGPTVSINPSATSLAAGGSLTLDSSGSSAPAGRTLTGYQWAITEGSDIAAFSGGTTGPTATVTTRAAGSFTVQLTLTDSAGATAARTQAISVSAATASPMGSTGSAGGGGGGVTSPLWLLALLAAASLSRPPARR